jgi:hypothetical protein
LSNFELLQESYFLSFKKFLLICIAMCASVGMDISFRFFIGVFLVDNLFLTSRTPLTPGGLKENSSNKITNSKTNLIFKCSKKKKWEHQLYTQSG